MELEASSLYIIKTGRILRRIVVRSCMLLTNTLFIYKKPGVTNRKPHILNECIFSKEEKVRLNIVAEISKILNEKETVQSNEIMKNMYDKQDFTKNLLFLFDFKKKKRFWVFALDSNKLDNIQSLCYNFIPLPQKVDESDILALKSQDGEVNSAHFENEISTRPGTLLSDSSSNKPLTQLKKKFFKSASVGKMNFKEKKNEISNFEKNKSLEENLLLAEECFLQMDFKSFKNKMIELSNIYVYECKKEEERKEPKLINYTNFIQILEIEFECLQMLFTGDLENLIPIQKRLNSLAKLNDFHTQKNLMLNNIDFLLNNLEVSLLLLGVGVLLKDSTTLTLSRFEKSYKIFKKLDENIIKFQTISNNQNNRFELLSSLIFLFLSFLPKSVVFFLKIMFKNLNLTSNSLIIIEKLSQNNGICSVRSKIFLLFYYNYIEKNRDKSLKIEFEPKSALSLFFKAKVCQNVVETLDYLNKIKIICNKNEIRPYLIDYEIGRLKFKQTDFDSTIEHLLPIISLFFGEKDLERKLLEKYNSKKRQIYFFLEKIPKNKKNVNFLLFSDQKISLTGNLVSASFFAKNQIDFGRFVLFLLSNVSDRNDNLVKKYLTYSPPTFILFELALLQKWLRKLPYLIYLNEQIQIWKGLFPLLIFSESIKDNKINFAIFLTNFSEIWIEKKIAQINENNIKTRLEILEKLCIKVCEKNDLLRKEFLRFKNKILQKRF